MFEALGESKALYIDMNDLMVVYHTIPHVKCAINALASMTSNGVFQVVNSKDEVVEGHKLTSLLNSPNFIQG